VVSCVSCGCVVWCGVLYLGHWSFQRPHNMPSLGNVRTAEKTKQEISKWMMRAKGHRTQLRFSRSNCRATEGVEVCPSNMSGVRRAYDCCVCGMKCSGP
jgi:uncharacterized membrane protein